MDSNGVLEPPLNIDDELALVEYQGPSGTVNLAIKTLHLMKDGQ